MTNSPAQLTVQQIAARLHEIFDGQIDLSDVVAKTPEHQEPFFRTRSYAALSLLAHTGVSPAEAASSITDGGDDDGIDAVLIDQSSKRIYFVQSKFKQNPAGGIDLSEVTRFRDGIKSVLNLDWSPMNANLHRFQADIEKALTDIETRVVMLFAHTSAEPLSKHINAQVKKFLLDQNKYNPDFIEFLEFDLSHGATAARYQARPANIDVSALLSHWGKIQSPYEAVYGTIAADDLADWHALHGNKLFAENLRFTIERSEVNDAIFSTAETEPNHFWYFNNGVTAICETFAKTPMGGARTESGVFEIKRISVINGAQTIGTLLRTRKSGSALDDARVPIRIISLKDTPEDFATSVTNANNTQNDLNPVDFVAADPNQERLRKEAAQQGLTYSFRRGDSEPPRDHGFDIRAATIAAACSSGELRLAVASKRYISGLWENPKKDPYTKLFNASTTASDLWRKVQIMRLVDDHLAKHAAEMTGRDRLVAVHGNRFMLYFIFEKMKSVTTVADDQIKAWVDTALPKLISEINNRFSDAYPGNVFKNQDKQTELLAAVV